MKYKHFENNEINNISTGERDANGVVIPTNALDSMMKQYLPERQNHPVRSASFIMTRV